ncbi:MAG: RagB/SusD family nutrient uptake outer membrane protein [Ignavibacteriales bacterium]|nr:RagB/SusD family nutrient uptake outer membrane protein [Ignavibacteriales bacterium]
MKRQKLFMMAVVVTTFIGCGDFLVEAPQQAIDVDEAMTKGSGVRAMVTGLYSGIHSPAIAGGNYNVIAEIMADNVLWTGSFVTYLDFHNRAMTPANANTTDWWTASYFAINRANIILDAVSTLVDPTDPNLTDAVKNVWRGDAYFGRGILLFKLAFVYSKPWNFTVGNTHLAVPIRTKPVRTPTELENLPRNTLAQVYAQVQADLDSAVNLLPATRPAAERGRATRHAARGYLMRLAMAKSDYAAAANYAQQIIAGGFSLPSSPALAFNGNKFSTESIFEIAWTTSDNPGPNAGQVAFYAPPANGGRGDIRISAAYVTAVGQIITAAQQAAVTAAGGTATDQRVITTAGNANRMLNGLTANTSATLKFALSDRSCNVINMRLPEVLLTRAEALAEQAVDLASVPAEVYTLLNQVRRRAILVSGGTSNQSMIDHSAASFTTKQELIDAILLERRIELAFEGDRFYTLHRKGLSIRLLAPSDNRITFPIPQPEVDANPNMVQNPGY